MEASEQSAKPALLPAGVNAETLRESLRGLKDLELGDSPAEAVAALREHLRSLLRDLELGDSPAEAAATLRDHVRGLVDFAVDLAAGNSGGPGATGSGHSAGATVTTPPFEERPELYVGAAFAGGLALAGLLRLLGR